MSNRPAVYFILLVVMIDAIGIGLIMPVMPDLLQDLGGGSLANAAIWGGILSTVFAGMQFLFGPLVGNLSDRFGRRKVLLVSLTVMSLDYVLMGLAHEMWLLFIARLLARDYGCEPFYGRGGDCGCVQAGRKRQQTLGCWARPLGLGSFWDR